MVRILTAEGSQCHHTVPRVVRSRVGACIPSPVPFLGHSSCLYLSILPRGCSMAQEGLLQCYRGFTVLQRSCKNQDPVSSRSWVQLDSVTPLGNYENYRLGHFRLNSPFLRMLVCSFISSGQMPSHKHGKSEKSETSERSRIIQSIFSLSSKMLV